MLQKLQVDPADIIGEAVPLEDKISVVQGGDLLVAGAAVPRVSTDVRLYPGQASARRSLPGASAKDGQPLYVEAPGTGRFRKARRDIAGGAAADQASGPGARFIVREWHPPPHLCCATMHTRLPCHGAACYSTSLTRNVKLS